MKKRKPRGKEKPGSLGKTFTATRRKKYLEELRATGEKALARLAAGVSSTCLRDHRLETAGFAEAEEEALELYRAEQIGATIHKRGVEGWDEPIYWRNPATGKPEVVGHVRKFSDKLLLAHAKRHMREEYGDKLTSDVNVTGLALADIRDLSTESRKLLEKILAIEVKRQKKKDDNRQNDKKGRDS